MMRDKSDRYRVETVSLPTPPKRLGSYLVDAGLLTDDQIKVALNDQQVTGMKFGEVLVVRGWLKEQTIEWIMKKVVVPERQSQQKAQVAQKSQATPTVPPQTPTQPPTNGTAQRRDVPITKPLPSVQPLDNSGVNWVG